MSMTRVRAVLRVREMLRDMDPSDALASDYTYAEVIERNANAIAGRVTLPLIAVASTSLVAETYEYTLTDVQVQRIEQVILNSNGKELVFVPWDEFNAHYRQDTATPVASGTPVEYTWSERASTGLGVNDTIIRVGPTPSAADAIDVYRANMPAAAATPNPSYLASADGFVIPFADDLMAALLAACAGEIASTSSADALAKRGLAPGAARAWLAQVEPAIRSYNLRMWRSQRAGHPIRSVRERTRMVRV